MIKINNYWITEAYEHTCSACGRVLARDAYERLYVIEMDKDTIELCSKCKKVLARKLNNYTV